MVNSTLVSDLSKRMRKKENLTQSPKGRSDGNRKRGSRTVGKPLWRKELFSGVLDSNSHKRESAKTIPGKTRGELKGRWFHILQVSETEEVRVVIGITARVKSRVKLLKALLILEYHDSLRKDLRFLKYYFPEFYSDWEVILIQDLILESRDQPKSKFNKRLKFLKDYGLISFEVQKESSILMVAGLEYSLQETPTRPHNTRYGYTKHYKDKGHLPPDKPDFTPEPEELEDAILFIMGKNETRARIRQFLLSKGKTKFEELFPNFRITTSEDD